MSRLALAVAVALTLCAPTFASSTTATNQQAVAPAGGTTVQKGVVTPPTKCPDGQLPDAKTGECPAPLKTVPMTTNGDANTSTDSVKQPTMK